MRFKVKGKQKGGGRRRPISNVTGLYFTGTANTKQPQSVPDPRPRDFVAPLYKLHHRRYPIDKVRFVSREKEKSKYSLEKKNDKT